MEKTTLSAGLSPQGIDRETFERVWRRVMPDQERSPIAVGPPEEARPKAPKPPPEQNLRPAAPTRRPEMDQTPTRIAPPPAPPAPMPRNDEERLHQLMDLAQEGAASGQTLARRGGAASRALSLMAADRRRALRQLSAACFLVTGRRYQPKAPGPVRETAMAQALRDQFLWEQRWTRTCLQAAEELEEASLRELCRELAREAVLHNRTIRQTLERM